jgi:hypothetical protein
LAPLSAATIIPPGFYNATMRVPFPEVALLVALILVLIAPAQAVLPPGNIVVHSTPPGALACIDTVDCDYTTANFVASADATHTVTVTADGYKRWTDTVYVTSGQTSVVAADLQLNPDVTKIQVYVTPGGGQVCLDNSQCNVNVGTPYGTGSTQFTGVSVGPHTISATAYGFRTYTEQVYVSLGSTSTIRIDLVSSSTPSGSIQVISTPDGATACVDGGNCLSAPVTFTGLNSGTYHTVVVSLPGYETYSENVYVVVGETTLVRASLPKVPPATGTVRVSVNLAGSTVCLDSADCHRDVGGTGAAGTGTTDFIDVPIGIDHTVDVSAVGYESYSARIPVSEGHVTTVDVTLQPITTPVPTPVTTAPVPTTTVPTPLPTRSGPGPVITLLAIALCGVGILVNKSRK